MKKVIAVMNERGGVEKSATILLPLILWHTEDNKYIILCGHNRRNTASLQD